MKEPNNKEILERLAVLENRSGGIQTSVARNAEAIELLKQLVAKKANKEVKKRASKRSTK